MGKCEKTPLWKIVELTFRFLSVGFIFGLYAHKNERCGWEQLEDAKLDSDFSIFDYFTGAYFTIHLITWFLVFAYVFRYVIYIGIDYILSCMEVSTQKSKACLFIVELIYGYWAAREIIGGWCDLEKIKGCIQTGASEEAYCESFVIKHLTIVVQSLCDRITSRYDQDSDSYLRPTNLRLSLFRFCGHFIMTLLSTLFSFFFFCF